MTQPALATQQEHNKMEELKNMFVRNVQHELRTPVSIIMGYAELLRDGTLGGLAPEQREAVFAIANQAQVLRKLVERITTLLVVEATKPPQLPLPLPDIVAGVIEANQPRATRTGLTLTADIPSDLPLVSGNPDHLQQAIECLVENAVKFTPEGGRVELKARAQADRIYLSITDTGIGIAPNKLRHIFDTFFQADGSTTRRYDGLGLGLTVAKAIIEAHGGQIEAESRPGEGSRFTITLPALTSLALAAQSFQQDFTLQRILIVDDEEYVALTLRDGLEKLPNCEIIAATSGNEALSYFAQQPFDLLITDYKMPDIDGITLTTKIQQLYPRTASIIITAYGDRIPHGAPIDVPVLDKPVTLAQIRTATLETLAKLRHAPTNEPWSQTNRYSQASAI